MSAVIDMGEVACVSALDADTNLGCFDQLCGSHPCPSCYFDNKIRPVQVVLRHDILNNYHSVSPLNASVKM
jgi:hypothetical protein